MLTDLARAHHIPVITSVLARSALSFDDPLNFGASEVPTDTGMQI